MVYYCSLGFHCHSTQLLIRNNLKKESYPFDWIFSSIFIVLDCLENDFSKLIDKRFYIDYHNQNNKTNQNNKINQNQCGHSYYKSNLFPHHDMRKIDNYMYLLRCIRRFKNICKMKEPKIFFITIIDIQLMTKIHENMTNLKNMLDKKTTDFTLVCFVFTNNQDSNHHYTEINDNIHIVYINVTSSSNGLEFENEKDNIYVDDIMKNYVSIDINN
tara:strand:+ start:717 stop:1361 length:645 start_codon:yes stop_codon:yes gene_type:complete